MTVPAGKKTFKTLKLENYRYDISLKLSRYVYDLSTFHLLKLRVSLKGGQRVYSKTLIKKYQEFIKTFILISLKNSL